MNIYLGYNELVCNFEDTSNSIGIYFDSMYDAKSSDEEIKRAILKMEYMILSCKRVLSDREEENKEKANG